jgi:hypothetical protein
MAKTVQSNSALSSSEHETTRSRNSVKKHRIIWGLDNFSFRVSRQHEKDGESSHPEVCAGLFRASHDG